MRALPAVALGLRPRARPLWGLRWASGATASSASSASPGSAAAAEAALLARVRLGQTRTRILTTALTLVPDYGWSTETLGAACVKEGVSPMAHGLFPRGAVELVDFFAAGCDASMRRILQDAAATLDPLPVEDRLHWALKARLEMLLPHIRTWPQALALLFHPSAVCTTVPKAAALVDDIYYAVAVDASTAVTRHAERAGLVATYGATELFLLQDRSSEYEETWAFLRRRIAEGGAAKRAVATVLWPLTG